MKKAKLTDLNRSNKDIWALIKVGLENKNLALIEKNLKRLYALQEYYIQLLNFNHFEIEALKNELNLEASLNNKYEREWFIGVAKRNGNYEELKQRIDTLFPEK